MEENAIALCQGRISRNVLPILETEPHPEGGQEPSQGDEKEDPGKPPREPGGRRAAGQPGAEPHQQAEHRKSAYKCGAQGPPESLWAIIDGMTRGIKFA